MYSQVVLYSAYENIQYSTTTYCNLLYNMSTKQLQYSTCSVRTVLLYSVLYEYMYIITYCMYKYVIQLYSILYYQSVLFTIRI